MDPALPIDVGIALVGSLMLALLVTLIALALRNRRRARLTIPAADIPAARTERMLGSSMMVLTGALLCRPSRLSGSTQGCSGPAE